MASFLDVCRFTPTLGGTTDWTFSSAVTGYQSPAAAGAVNGLTYRYRAESADLSQWEVGYGKYTSAGTVLTRSTVLFNSSGTTAKISFSAAPQVAIVALAEDLYITNGLLYGLTLSAAGSTATFGIAAGQAADSTNIDFMTLASAYTKTTSAWAVGTGNGAMDTGAVAASSWYHVHLIKRQDTGVVDVLFSLSATAPTLPTNYNIFRRIGSMKTDGASQWVKFLQIGDEFWWDVPIQDINSVNITTTSTLFTITVPTGVNIRAKFNAYGFNSGTAIILLFQSPLVATAVANAPSGNMNIFGAGANLGQAGQFEIMTNTSAQIRAVTAHASGTTVNEATTGWIDYRGRKG